MGKWQDKFGNERKLEKEKSGEKLEKIWLLDNCPIKILKIKIDWTSVQGRREEKRRGYCLY